MTHSVEKHLAVAPEAYDAEIRRFVPEYEAMLDEIAGAIARMRGADAAIELLDLGAGTGALSGVLAEQLPNAALTLVDADAGMLERAAERLSAHRLRVSLRAQSFFEPLPACDVAVASLALHHVRDAGQKRALYTHIRGAIRDGGVLFNADVTIPRVRALADHARARWAAHLAAHGDTEAQAYARFDDWAKEDTYFAIEEELDMLRGAGFAAVDVLFRCGPATVLVAVP